MATHSKKRLAASKVGRPPAGERGERVKDYPQVSFRLPQGARARLVASSKVLKQPQWRVIVEAVECYVRALPRQRRMQIARMMSSNR
jgi:hypothetical protein